MTGTRVLLFITIFLFISFKSVAAVFVVTSNADSGPGTLREALTLAAANGNAEKDYINFNLPDLSEAGRTITLLTQLPNVSSNLVIDGSTQPGAKFGVSDAKVILQPDPVNNHFNGLTLTKIDGFELYGFYIRDFISNLFEWHFLDIQEFGIASALYVEACKNIQLGAPSKGNVFARNGYALHLTYISSDDHFNYAEGIENFKAYSNFIGIEPDGKSYRPSNIGAQGLDITSCKGNIDIGGDDVAQRNFFGNSPEFIVQAYRAQSFIHPSVINIKNNYFNYGFDGTPIPNIYSDGPTYLIRFGSDPNSQVDNQYTFNIINNKIQFPIRTYIAAVSGDIIFQGNQELKSLGPIDPFEKRSILVTTKGKLLMGGDQPGQENILYGLQYALFSKKSLIIDHSTIYCEDNGYAWTPGTEDLLHSLPKINITKITSTSVSGTAPPLSSIQLYWDDECHLCQPQTFFSKLNADANGNWTYNGPITSGVIAIATINGFSSLFTTSATLTDFKLVHSSCGQNNGSIKSQFLYAGGYEMRNEQNEIIAYDKNKDGLAPGKYTVTALNGTSCTRATAFEILDATPKINDSQIQRSMPSCNSNGSITNIYLDNYEILQSDYQAYTYKWIDQNGVVKSTSLDLTDAPPGAYRLIVTYKDQCPVTYGPVILKNVSGPNIDQSHPDIQSTSCAQSTGSIKNIIVTGTGNIKYSWLNAQHQEVATTNDLTGQPAGIYTLKVTDDTQCGEVYSSEINIPEINGITLDESNVTRSPATCSQNNGSIKGIIAPGATHYKWINIANNSVAGSSPELVNAATGSYQLTASNDFGCSKTSQVYTIDITSGTVYPNYTANINNSCAGQNNGSITIIPTDNLVKSMRWIDANGQPAGTDANAHDLKPGVYKVYFTDASGCETLYPHDFTVNDIPILQIDGNSIIQTNDQCGLKTGSIKNIQVTGGTPPYTYLWVDVAGNHLSTSSSLTGVGEGTYSLQVHDSGNSTCSPVTGIAFNISNENSTIDAPLVNPLQLCAPGRAQLAVSSPSAGSTYRLYSSAQEPTALDEQANGVFKINVNANSTFYISRVNGQCESERTAAQITVNLSAIDIPNAFTPNGDGRNDYWKINNAQNYPQAIVQIFTRYGQKVFESKGYSVPFDGTYNGSKLPAGVYYYILNLGKSCKLLSGNLTLIR
jgi:gliding motility-associated-like protein